MVRWEWGTITGARRSWPGAARLQLMLDGEEQPVTAMAYPQLTGTPQPGERVLVNTNALRRGLGTGGEALVVARPQALEPGVEPAGHMVKARYTPMQTMVDAIDDPSSPHYEVLQAAEDLEAVPVVACDLHSSLPAIVAGIRAEAPGARIVHVHTDGAALPAAYSATASGLCEAGLMEATISAGQSFGGALEAVTTHSALLGARHVARADVVIAVQGPGNLGTGTGWGFSGLQAAEALHAAAVLGGRPVAALRVSGADARPRHRGLSHHSSTTYGRATLAPVLLPLLDPTAPEYSWFHASVSEQVNTTIIEEASARGVHHERSEVSPAGLQDALRGLPVRLSTMGRTLEEDPEAFLYAALAGRCAAALIPRP
ncbi:MAG TPA: DUF3866 family protein [Candidatus Brachybacterium merdavium]|uniref:DUF3866 family protein n=1 Tax=Candidatus Brachybacterium merdavium TaxID=2838513 RepID=A0A9D2LCD2_9MICO|nr:DUF3866 family protein [Candidatus Brachybacterium merdavium]